MGDSPLILVYESRPQTSRKVNGLVVQVSGGALARKSCVAPSIKINQRYGEIGTTQF
jgi:hypothetical protein